MSAGVYHWYDRITGLLFFILLTQYVTVYLITTRQALENQDFTLTDTRNHSQLASELDSSHVKRQSEDDWVLRILISDPYFGAIFQQIEKSNMQDVFRQALRHASYIVLPNVLSSQRAPRKEGITICTHASLDNLRAIRHQAIAFQNQGTISLALFIEKEFAVSLALLSRLATCSDLSNVGVHIVLVDGDQLSQPINLREIALILTTTCEELLSVQDQPAFNYNARHPYPNNALRNIARDYAVTDFITVLDIDVVPSAGLVDAFIEAKQSFSESEIPRVAFVLPEFMLFHEAFEISDSVSKNIYPRTRADILQAIEDKIGQPFYKDVCWKCQRYTDYEKWQSDPSSKLYYEGPSYLFFQFPGKIHGNHSTSPIGLLAYHLMSDS
eukprot:gene9245-1527_t